MLTNSVMATVNQGPVGGAQPLSPTAALVLMAAYAAAALTVGAVLFVKRDG
jgi:hypothetical protein